MTNSFTSRLRRRKSPLSFPRDTRAVGAVEFALTFPMVLMLLICTSEYVRFTFWARHVSQLADTVAEVVSTKTTTLQDADIDLVWDSALAIIPDAPTFAQIFGKTWREVVRVRVSSATIAKFNQSCTSNCAVQATVDWSAGASSMKRACGTLSPVADNASSDPSSIPESMLVVSSTIIADVEADYQPTIGSFWISSFTLRRSAYFVPRPQSSIPYSPSGLGYVCP